MIESKMLRCVRKCATPKTWLCRRGCTGTQKSDTAATSPVFDLAFLEPDLDHRVEWHLPRSLRVFVKAGLLVGVQDEDRPVDQIIKACVAPHRIGLALSSRSTSARVERSGTIPHHSFALLEDA